MASTSAPSKRQKVLADNVAPVDHAALFSKEGQARKMARLRIITTTFAGREGVIGLHGGLPPATAFPITEMSLKLRDGSRIVIDDPAKACLLRPFDFALSSVQASSLVNIQCWSREALGYKHTSGSKSLV